MINIVLYEPEIPQNTGNIMRTCAGTGTKLHLIKPLGFSLDENHLRRAGVNYIENCDYNVYENWEDFCSKNSGTFYYLTRYGKKPHTSFDYSDVDEEMLGLSLWAPQLIALHHPFVADPAVYPASLDVAFKSGITDWEHNLEDIAGGNFCVTANILQCGFFANETDNSTWFDRLEKDWMELIERSEDAEERPITAILSSSLLRSFYFTPMKAILPCQRKFHSPRSYQESFFCLLRGSFFVRPRRHT